MRDAKVVGRQRKGQGAFFEEEADRWDDQDEEEENEDDTRKRKVRFSTAEADDDDDAADAGEKDIFDAFQKKREMRGASTLGAAVEKNSDGKADEEGGDDSDVGEMFEDDEDEEQRSQYERESGITIEPFNMRQEREEGYSIKKEKGGLWYIEAPKKQMQDAWLEEYDEKWSKELGTKSGRAAALALRKKKAGSMKNSANDSNKRARLDAAAENNEEDEDEDAFNIDDCKRQVCSMLKPQENVNQALRRLKKESNGNNAAPEMKALEELSGMADKLLSRGYINVYSDSKEKMNASVRQWEYSVSEDGSGEVFGPFTFAQMMGWLKQGCFNQNPFSLREAGEGNSFTRVEGPDEVLQMLTS